MTGSMHTGSRLLVAAALAALALACGGGEAPDASAGAPTPGHDGAGDAHNDGPIGQAFAAAALEFDLDVELLKALGYVSSRFDHRGGAPSMEGGYGIMNLVSREDRDMVAEAAEVIDVDPSLVRRDLAVNVRAGAALLRLYAEQQAADPAELDGAPAEAFRDALARWAGETDPLVVESFLEEVYRVYYEGAGLTVDGESIEVIGQGVADDFSDAVTQSLAHVSQGVGEGGSVDRYVPATPANYYTGRAGQRVTKITIHTTQGSYAGAISWFQNPRANVSAHYVIRSSDGQITQTVRERDTAWHAGVANRYTVGIEHEGFVSNAAWYTEAMYRSSARLTCEIARRHGVPLDRDHIVGHVELPQQTHTDPGRYWDWSHYMSLVRAACNGSGGSSGGGSNGGGAQQGGGSGGGDALLQGVIFRGADQHARLGGVRVEVAGRTATTNGNGYYALRVPPGRHEIRASKSGWRARTIRRDVSRGGDAWGSMGLQRSGDSGGETRSGARPGDGAGAANATLTGVIFARPDADARLAGASVRLSTGERVTTGADGRYSFRVQRGRTYRVTASKSGFTTKLITREIDVAEKWGSIGLPRSEGTGVLRGVVFEAPNLGRRVAGATVRLSTGQRATSAADGSYSFRVPAGAYTVVASKAGFAPRTLQRNVEGRLTSWASLGLTPVTEDGGGAAQPGALDADAPVLLAPIDGAVVAADPEFVFRAPAALVGRAAEYTLVVASETNAVFVPLIFSLDEPAGPQELRRRVGANLAPDRYTWIVWGRDPATRERTLLSEPGLFIVP